MTEKEKQGREQVAAWSAGGLTQRRYCEEHHYSRSALGYWSRKISNEKKTRKQIGGLALLVEAQMGHSPFEESLFAFCNRERGIMKMLYGEKNRFCMWQKRPEKHRFPWPQNEEAAQEISVELVRMVLAGIDFWNADTGLNYTHVG